MREPLNGGGDFAHVSENPRALCVLPPYSPVTMELKAVLYLEPTTDDSASTSGPKSGSSARTVGL